MRRNMRYDDLHIDHVVVCERLYTINALYNFASCGRAHDKILAWTNLDLGVECFKRAGVQVCERAGVDK